VFLWGNLRGIKVWFLGKGERQQQIPFGDDNQKGKCNGKCDANATVSANATTTTTTTANANATATANANATATGNGKCTAENKCKYRIPSPFDFAQGQDDGPERGG
jgi:hypothetical protein